MSDRVWLQLIELLVTSISAGLTTSAGLMALVHAQSWLDAGFAFVVPFLFTLGAGLRNLYKDKPATMQ